MILSTDRQPPSEAAHQVTLLAGGMCQELTFPWPFKVADVHSSCETETSRVRLILPKSTNEPHPYEWNNRKKWDISSLSLWDAKSLLKDLNYHLCAQFHCRELKQQMLNETEDDTVRTNSCVKGVREIIRTLFQSTTLDGNLLYVIRSKVFSNFFQLNVFLKLFSKCIS
jgi:MYND finger